MTDVSATTAPSTSTSGSISTSGSQLASATSSLGESDFLQLMMDQLKNQDPLSPNDPTQYLSELANFSSLEQDTSIASATSTTATEQASAAALAMIGHTVSYTDTNGDTQSGVVGSVQFTSAGPTLTVGSTSGVALGSVTEAS